jgi:hypothetical protein
LISGFFVTVPAGNNAGEFVGNKSKTPIILMQGLESIAFVIGIDGGVQPGLTDKLCTLIHQGIIQIIKKNNRF